MAEAHYVYSEVKRGKDIKELRTISGSNPKIVLQRGTSTEWFAYCLESDVDTFDEEACDAWQRAWNPVYEPWRYGDYHRWCIIA